MGANDASVDDDEDDEDNKVTCDDGTANDTISLPPFDGFALDDDGDDGVLDDC
jgi:hypothetical protein